jgi:hypothetical protein
LAPFPDAWHFLISHPPVSNHMDLNGVNGSFSVSVSLFPSFPSHHAFHQSYLPRQQNRGPGVKESDDQPPRKRETWWFARLRHKTRHFTSHTFLITTLIIVSNDVKPQHDGRTSHTKLLSCSLFKINFV